MYVHLFKRTFSTTTTTTKTLTRCSPSASFLIGKYKIPIDGINATGPKGIISKLDVLNWLSIQAKHESIERNDGAIDTRQYVMRQTVNTSLNDRHLNTVVEDEAYDNRHLNTAVEDKAYNDRHLNTAIKDTSHVDRQFYSFYLNIQDNPTNDQRLILLKMLISSLSNATPSSSVTSFKLINHPNGVIQIDIARSLFEKNAHSILTALGMQDDFIKP